MSEIFDEYARIALEQGLITEAKAESKKPNPRYDSLDLEAIEMLYGVKPNDKEDDSKSGFMSTLEKAHPEPVIVAPSYDKLNGLVENLIERQNVMVGIALKPNDGKLVQRRYVTAHNELLNELLKTAFMLDKKGEDDLMKLADSCSQRIVNENFIKEAWSWGDLWSGLGIGVAAVAPIIATIAGTAGTGAALLGGPVGWGIGAGVLLVTSLLNNFGDNIDQGFVANCQRATECLQDVLDDPDEVKGIGDDISRWMDTIRSAEDVFKTAMDSTVEGKMEDVENGKNLLNKCFNVATILSRDIPSWIRLLMATKDMPDKEKSNNLWALLGYVGDVVFSSDIKNAITALKTLKDSVSKSKSALIEMYNSKVHYLESNKDEIKQALSDFNDKNVKAPSDTFGLAEEVSETKPLDGEEETSGNNAEQLQTDLFNS
jgi:hypothetical protein